MASLYGEVQGSRGPTHRLGGGYMRVTAASWNGAVTTVFRKEKDGRIAFEIYEHKWEGHGREKPIASGFLGED